ncbi:hypothetical protein [Crocosphaera sp. XPORK-15E]|uniref:hypothetical protein n=1 Tax=Crocosphaera sp. XPORK-15E TaxID=3110247 RepID=UPI002B216275|nr:hypothetical protein [Crocosphaera sp. XPORK-15E]MEA5535525.1 hypothetical protein [Crocosphaera sp. XPORK-15E]
MSKQEIEALESKLYTARCHIEEKHKTLKAKLKTLNKELKLAIKSYEKLRILNNIDAIEQEIKVDLAAFPLNYLVFNQVFYSLKK